MAVSSIVDLNLGKLTQIIMSEGVRNQLSADYNDFEMIAMKNKAGIAGARQIDFLFQTGNGPARVQMRNATTAAFPASQAITVQEYTARFKEMDATIRVDYNLWNRLRKNPKKYAQDLALELESTQVAIKRNLASMLHDDGTGVICTLVSAAEIGTSNVCLFTVDPAYNVRGSIGRVEIDDLLIVKAPDTTARTNDGSSFYAYKVLSKTRSETAPTFTAVPVNAAGTALAFSSVGGATAGDLVYRVGQPTFVNTSTFAADYGTATDVLAGLPSLVSNDGRALHGITMSGSCGAQVIDCGGDVADTTHLRRALDALTLACGQNAYSYSQALASPEAIGVFIDSKESDRRFNSVDDNSRGSKKFIFQHFKNSVELMPSEFISNRNMYILPDSTQGNKSVLEFYFNDMELVRPDDSGSGFQLEANSAGYNRAMVAYMTGCMTMINKRPSATAKITNFLLS